METETKARRRLLNMEIKAIVRYRDGFKCTLCGMTEDEHFSVFGKTLDVHRKTPGSPYTIDGCVTVCRTCHGPLPKSGKPNKLGREPIPRTDDGSTTIGLRLPKELLEALNAYIARFEVPVSITAVVRKAIEDFLAEAGHWPPKK